MREGSDMTRTFYYNGVKGDEGKLVKCHYSMAELRNYPEGTITIYVKSILDSFPKIAGLTARNDTDITTDYFEADVVRVTPDNARYAEVLAAHQQAQEKAIARMAARR